MCFCAKDKCVPYRINSSKSRLNFMIRINHSLILHPVKNPDYHPGYMCLLDNLIVELRLEEALEIIQTIDRIKHDYYSVLMEGDVRSLLGNYEAAETLFTKAMEAD